MTNTAWTGIQNTNNENEIARCFRGAHFDEWGPQQPHSREWGAVVVECWQRGNIIGSIECNHIKGFVFWIIHWRSPNFFDNNNKLAPSRILLAIIRSVSPQSKIFHFEENENAEQDEEEKWLRKCTRYNKSGWRGEIILCTCKYVTTMARAERDDRRSKRCWYLLRMDRGRCGKLFWEEEEEVVQHQSKEE